MRITSASRGIAAGKLAAVFAASVFLWACSSGSDNDTRGTAAAGNDAGSAAAPAQPGSGSATPGIKTGAVSASVEGSGDVLAYVGSATTVTLAFTVSDGAATALKLQLPADPGWSSADGVLGCDSLSASQPCKLRLRYTPPASAASATLKLSYTYTDGAGKAQSGALSVNYQARAANAATVAADPAGTVNAIVGAASTVTLRFGTNDGSPASALQLDLAALPAGWSGGGSACPSFGGDAACQLQLVYQPTAATTASSFDLPYRYVDSAGNAQAAKLAIAYAARAANTVNASIAPAGEVAVRPGASRDVTLTFVPSDTYAVSAVALADAAAALPEGWSIQSSTLPCDQAGPGGNCKLVLRFAPTASAPPQQLDLNFSYVNAIGQAQSGKASIAYSSRIYDAYVADIYSGADGGVRQCEVAPDGSLGNCAQAASTWKQPTTSKLIVSGSRAWIATSMPAKTQSRALSVCGIDVDGGLVNCADAGVSYDGIASLALLGQSVYLVSPIDNAGAKFNRITGCTLNDYGIVQGNGCAQLSLDATGAVVPTALTAFKSALYIAAAVDTSSTGARVLRCVPDPANAAQPQCESVDAAYPQTVQALAGLSLPGGDYLYLLSADNSSGALVKCILKVDGSVAGCDGGSVPSGLAAADLAQGADIAIANGQAYIVVAGGAQKGVLRCAIDAASGDVQSCTAAGDTGSAVPAGIALR